MNTLTANEIKTEGVSAIRRGLEKDDELIITVRGKAEYAVISMKKLGKYHEYELDVALSECREDIKSGRFHVDTEKHIRTIKKSLRNLKS